MANAFGLQPLNDYPTGGQILGGSGLGLGGFGTITTSASTDDASNAWFQWADVGTASGSITTQNP